MMINTHSQTSNTTCCKRSGNFCTIVTGWPLVKLTPYIGAVVLYLVLHNLAGEPHVSLEENPLPKTKNTPTHMKKIISRYLEFIIIFHIFKMFRIFKEIFNFLAKNLRKKSRKNYLIKKKIWITSKEEEVLSQTCLRDSRPFFGILSVHVFETSGSPVSRYEQNER